MFKKNLDEAFAARDKRLEDQQAHEAAGLPIVTVLVDPDLANLFAKAVKRSNLGENEFAAACLLAGVIAILHEDEIPGKYNPQAIAEAASVRRLLAADRLGKATDRINENADRLNRLADQIEGIEPLPTRSLN